MSVILLPPSDMELQGAIDYYNDQMFGLGERFYQSFLEAIRHIEAGPELWRKIGDHTRRINIGRFPYLILYVEHEEDIIITCIAHQHRDPQYYMNRMGD